MAEPAGHREQTPWSARVQSAGRGAVRWAPLVVLILGLLVEGGVVLGEARRLWFWRDDWVFLLNTNHPGPWGVLVLDYNGHWSTWPWLWFRLLIHVFGARHYLPYAVAPVLLHVAACVLMYVVLRRARIGEWPAVLATLVTGFLAGGAGAQNPLWAFQVGFLGSVVLGLLALLFADLGGRWRWLAPLALLLAVMCSNVGLILLALVAGWALVRHGLRTTLTIIAGPTVIYLAWYAAYGHANTEPLQLAHGAQRTMAGLDNVWSAATEVPSAGAAVLLALGAAVLLVRRDISLASLGAGGLVALVLGYMLFGFGKSGDQGMPTESRYVYVGILVCGPALACLFRAVAVRGRELPWAVGLGGALTLLLAGIIGGSQTTTAAAELRPQTTELRGRVLATHWLITHHATFLGNQVWRSPGINQPVTVDSIRRGTQAGLFRSVRPSAKWLLETRGQVQVAVGARKPDVPMVAATWGGATGTGLHVKPQVPGLTCEQRDVTGSAWLDLSTGTDGGQVWLRTTGSPTDTLQTQLIAGSDRSSLRSWPGVAGNGAFVATTAPHLRMQIVVPRGTVVVCTG